MCPEFRGANVTIPLKERIVDLMDELDDTARKIGAMNTVVPNSRNAFVSPDSTPMHTDS
jgi:shikimate 5-dehydrogenase